MDKESIYLLQKVDCNCNDCIFMKRNMDKYKLALERHHKWQLDYFTTIKNKLINKALQRKRLKYDLETWDALMIEAENMEFSFDKSTVSINYGECTKFNKCVSFIPNTLQLETQKCFKHRKDEINS